MTPVSKDCNKTDRTILGPRSDDTSREAAPKDNYSQSNASNRQQIQRFLGRNALFPLRGKNALAKKRFGLVDRRVNRRKIEVTLDLEDMNRIVCGIGRKRLGEIDGVKLESKNEEERNERRFGA